MGAKAQKASTKRIHKVVIKRMIDESPDTSWLGEYSNRATSEFSIDRAHDLDCLCQPYNRITGEGLRVLESAQQYLCDRMNETTEDEDLRIWYDDGDSFVSTLIAGDAEEFCLGSCVSHWSNREYRYFNPSFNYVDKSGHALPENTPEEVRKYVLQDYARMEALNNNEFGFIGLRADAEYSVGGTPAPIQTVTSGGLWGIESDSDADFLRDTENEQLSELRSQLEAIGFSKRAVSAAFRNVEREGE